jgi:hypothetical protein
MKRKWIYLALLASVAVFAQQQATDDEDPSAPEEIAETASPQGDGDIDSGDPENQDELNEDGLAIDPEVLEPPEEDEIPDPEAELADPETDFEPDEEISEDYPVPLPSDI